MSAQGDDKLFFCFYDSLPQRQGTIVFNFFGSITYSNTKGDKAIPLLCAFCDEILVTKLIPIGWANKDRWNQEKPNQLVSVPLCFAKTHTQLKTQF